jgi:hypothetical protein
MNQLRRSQSQTLLLRYRSVPHMMFYSSCFLKLNLVFQGVNVQPRPDPELPADAARPRAGAAPQQPRDARQQHRPRPAHQAGLRHGQDNQGDAQAHHQGEGGDGRQIKLQVSGG